MARLFTSGFEINSLTSEMEFNTITGSPTLSSSIKRSGSYSMRCNPSSATAYASIIFNSSFVADIYCRAYIRIDTAPSADTLILQFSNVGTLQAGIILKTDRTLQGVGQLKATIGSPSSALSLNTWYRVEMWAANPGATTGSSDFRLDGTSFASHTAASPDIDTFDQFEVGIIESTSADVYFDDVAINDTAGSFQTSWPGVGSIVHITPDGDSSLGWATINPASPTTHYDKVNENPPDNATSYIEDTTLNNKDIFTLASTSSAGINSGDTITLITANTRWMDVGLSSATLTVGISDGTNEETGNLDVDSSDTWATNTHHAQAGTLNYRPAVTLYNQVGSSTTVMSPSDVDGYLITAKNGDGDTYRVSGLWVLIEYVPAAGGAASGNDWPIMTPSSKKFWSWRYS